MRIGTDASATSEAVSEGIRVWSGGCPESQGGSLFSPTQLASPTLPFLGHVPSTFLVPEAPFSAQEDAALLGLDTYCRGTASCESLFWGVLLPWDSMLALLRASGSAPSIRLGAERTSCISPFETRSS